MDLVRQARVEKIGELLSTVYESAERMKARNEMPREKSALLDLSPRDQERWSWRRAIISQLATPHLGRHSDGFENECSEEIKKLLNIQCGGIAIPIDMLHYRSPRPSYSVGASAPAGLSFIDMLRNASCVLTLGVQILEDLLGPAGVTTILKLNRIDLAHAHAGDTLLVPDGAGPEMGFAPFPVVVSSLDSVPRLIAVSQRVQAFGAYEHGRLVYWGPTSTGKAKTPTPNALYFTNWKRKD